MNRGSAFSINLKAKTNDRLQLQSSFANRSSTVLTSSRGVPRASQRAERAGVALNCGATSFASETGTRPLRASIGKPRPP
jgi:hypothetical protein